MEMIIILLQRVIVEVTYRISRADFCFEDSEVPKRAWTLYIELKTPGSICK